MLDRKRIDFKLGSYGVAPAAALENSLWLARTQTFRRQMGARMVAFDKSTAAKKLPPEPFHVSKKIDGEFNVLLYRDGEALLINPGGTVRCGLPLLAEAADLLKKAGLSQALIAGELHVRKPGGARGRVHDVSRFARKPENQDQVEALCFAPFDIVEIDGAEWTEKYPDTYAKLESLLGKSDRVQPVPTEIGQGSKGVLAFFEKWVENEGAEGVVARNDESGWFKIKPRHSFDVAVIGFAEGTDDRSGMLHDLLLGIYRADGTVQVLGRVGGGFSDDQRRDFLSDLRDMTVESDYIEVNSDRVAYEMVRPEWVVEISCLDLISSTTRGAPIDRMVLEWEPAGEGKGMWRATRRLPLCSIISPQFVRLRTDKSPGVRDCRFSQLTDIVEIELAEATSADLQLPRSELLKREVRVKELKGSLMVRKLLLWKTNKEEITRGEFPAYVAHLTDFSPNRKDPIKREIRVSDSRDQIEKLYHELFLEAMEVKGWADPAPVVTMPDKTAPAPAKKTAAKKVAANQTAAIPAPPAPADSPVETVTTRLKKTPSRKTPKKQPAAPAEMQPAAEPVTRPDPASAGSKKTPARKSTAKKRGAARPPDAEEPQAAPLAKKKASAGKKKR